LARAAGGQGRVPGDGKVGGELEEGVWGEGGRGGETGGGRGVKRAGKSQVTWKLG